MGDVVQAQFGQQKEKESRKVSLNDGYTRTADELIEELARTDLSGREFRVLLVVIRKTFGFGKSVDWIALPQFIEMMTKGDKGTLQKHHISTLIKGLVARRILLRKVQGRDQKLGINSVVTEWQEKPKAIKKSSSKPSNNGVTKNGNERSEKGNKPSEKGNGRSVLGNHNKQETNKELKDSSSELTSRPADRPDAVVQSPNGKKWGEAVDLQLAQAIYERVKEITESTREPNWADWSNVIRLMREKDQREPEHIGALFSWANQDSFWKTNILSPSSLRDKWGKLAAKRHEERNGSKAHSNGRTQKTTAEKLTDTDWAEGLEYDFTEEDQ